MSTCAPCQKAHAACSGARPCDRCFRLNACEGCIDAVKRKRGRPPLSMAVLSQRANPNSEPSSPTAISSPPSLSSSLSSNESSSPPQIITLGRSSDGLSTLTTSSQTAAITTTDILELPSDLMFDESLTLNHTLLGVNSPLTFASESYGTSVDSLDVLPGTMIVSNQVISEIPPRIFSTIAPQQFSPSFPTMLSSVTSPTTFSTFSSPSATIASTITTPTTSMTPTTIATTTYKSPAKSASGPVKRRRTNNGQYESIIAHLTQQNQKLEGMLTSMYGIIENLKSDHKLLAKGDTERLTSALLDGPQFTVKNSLVILALQTVVPVSYSYTFSMKCMWMCKDSSLIDCDDQFAKFFNVELDKPFFIRCISAKEKDKAQKCCSIGTESAVVLRRNGQEYNMFSRVYATGGEYFGLEFRV